MNKYEKKELFFDHIPKTAGTSIHNAFRSILCSYGMPEKISNGYSCLLDKNAMGSCGGHVYFMHGDTLSPIHYHATVLRDPIDRLISQYHHSRHVGLECLKNGQLADPRLADIQVLMALKQSFDEYIKNKELAARVFNVQARHFALRVSPNTDLVDDESLLDAAIASLEGYDLVGSFDNLQGFVDAVARDFERDSVTLQWLNKTSKGYEAGGIKKNTRDLLVRGNRVDHKLLDWADKRFGWKKQHAPKLIGKKMDHAKSGEVSVKQRLSDESIEEYGEKYIRIISVECYGAQSGAMVIAPGEDLFIDAHLEASITVTDMTVGIALRDKQGDLVYGVNSLMVGTRVSIDRPGLHTVRIKLKNRLDPGLYVVTLALHKGRAHVEGCYHWLENAIGFAVFSLDKQGYEGIVDCQAAFTKLELENNG